MSLRRDSGAAPCPPRFLLTAALTPLLLASCASVPTEVAQLHRRELAIISSLHASHMAMIDAYVDQRIAVFDEFFFSTYGPAYLANWKDAFKTVHGRDFDELRDFSLLYSDLVAEYQAEVAPLEEVRRALREAIAREYLHAVEAHESVGAWLDSMQKLNSAQRQSMDRLLEAIRPGLSLESVDTALGNALEKVRAKIPGAGPG